VSGVFVINMVTSGLGFYAMSPYLRELVDREGFSNSLASLGTGLFFLSSGVTGYLISGFVNRLDVRRIIVAGGLWGGAMLALLGHVAQVWQLLVVQVLFGAGFAACGLVVANTVITRWFVRRRSLALSVSATGLSAGGIVLTQNVARLVLDRGMAATTPWLGLLWAVAIVPVALFVVKPSPQALGLLPDGDPPETRAVGAPPPGTTFEAARRTRFYLLLTAAYLFVMLSQVGALAHQTKLGTDRVSIETGNLAVSLTAAASVIGRLAGGALLPRLNSRWFTAALIALQGSALLVLSAAHGRGQFVAGSLLLGLAVGNLLMLHPLLLAEAYGVADYARIYRLSNLVMTLGVAVGPTLVGVLEETRGYGVAFAVTAGSSLCGFLLFTSAGAVLPPAAPAPRPAKVSVGG
jgi:MFS family permease